MVCRVSQASCVLTANANGGRKFRILGLAVASPFLMALVSCSLLYDPNEVTVAVPVDPAPPVVQADPHQANQTDPHEVIVEQLEPPRPAGPASSRTPSGYGVTPPSSRPAADRGWQDAPVEYQVPVSEPVALPAPVPAALPSVEELPTYRRLAYQPERETSILDLSPTFYTVQLVAVSTKEALEEHVRELGLQSMSAARIESGGDLYYVLLLGVYPTETTARTAAASLPPGLENVTAWVRSLSSLQDAIRRADRLAGSADF